MMRISIFALGAVIAAICALSACAQTLTPSGETWICTWTRPGDRGLSYLRLSVEGGNLIGIGGPDPRGWHIVANDPGGIVAVYSFATLEPNHNEATIGAEVIMLDKRSLAFRVLDVYLHRPAMVDSRGTCMRG
jgi:hypothetical protein